MTTVSRDNGGRQALWLLRYHLAVFRYVYGSAIHASRLAGIVCSASKRLADSFCKVVRFLFSLRGCHGPFSNSFGTPEEFSYTVQVSASGM